jgi:hypothetical protein
VTARPTTPFPKPGVPIHRPTRSGLRRAADSYGVIAVSAAALVWLALSGGGYGPVPRHVAGVVVWLFAFGVLLWGGPRVVPHGPVRTVALALAAFAALTGLSMVWSESAGRSYDELTRVLLYLGVFVVVAGIGAGSRRRRAQLLEGITLGTVVVVALAVLSRLEPALFPEQELQRLAPAFRPRLAYPFNYWNAVGSFVAIAIVLLVHAAGRLDRGRVFRAAATAALPLAGLALYLTFSRGGLIAAAVGCAVYLAFSPRRLAAFGSIAIGGIGTALLAVLTRHYRALNDGLLDQADARSGGHKVLVALVVVSAAAFAARLLAERTTLPRRAADVLTPHRRKIAVAGALLCLVAAVVVAPKVANRAESFRDPVVFQGNVTTDRIESRLTSGSANGRYQLWESSWNAWKGAPVTGHGAGTWEFWWRRNATINNPSRDSHSLFFDVLAELGTLGVIALLALVGLALWTCLAAARTAGGGERACLVAIGAAAVAWTLGAATDWLWEMPAVTVLFAALVALAASARSDQVAAAAERERPQRSRAVGALAGAAWLVVVVQAVALIAAWNLERSQIALREGRFQDAQDSAEVVRIVEPWAADGYMQLALVRLQFTPDQKAVDLARQAVDRERTNWRPWLVLVRIEARAGRLGEATRDLHEVRRLAKGSALIPSYQDLLDISTGRRDP